jgi:hypothetical protein
VCSKNECAELRPYCARANDAEMSMPCRTIPRNDELRRRANAGKTRTKPQKLQGQIHVKRHGP